MAILKTQIEKRNPQNSINLKKAIKIEWERVSYEVIQQTILKTTKKVAKDVFKMNRE